jgi:hypothetical protein
VFLTLTATPFRFQLFEPHSNALDAPAVALSFRPKIFLSLFKVLINNRTGLATDYTTSLRKVYLRIHFCAISDSEDCQSVHVVLLSSESSLTDN